MVQVQESIRGLRVEDIDADAMRLLKQYGTSDAEIAALTGSDERFVRAYRKGLGVVPSMKTVDTCAAEFSSATEYHYKTYENIYRTSGCQERAWLPTRPTPADKPKAMILAPAQPHWPRYRVRLLLRARELRTGGSRLRDHHSQLQPRDRFD